MTHCDLEKVDAKDLPIGKLIGILAKAQSIYFNNMLSELDINITQLHILFEVAGDSTLNQEKIASRCNTNKGAIARSIKKLEDNGFIERTIDENNRRQNIISMTEKGEMTFNKSKDNLKEFEDILFENQQEKENLQIILKNLAIKMTSLNEERFDKK